MTLILKDTNSIFLEILYPKLFSWVRVNVSKNLITYEVEKSIWVDLNEELMKRNDVDDHPTLVVKLPWACEYAQSLSYFTVEHYLKFSIMDDANMQPSMDTLNKMLISNINKHHQKTIDSYVHTVWDCFSFSLFKLNIVWKRTLCTYFFNNNVPSYLRTFIVYNETTTYIEIDHFLE